jgi:hypothetical protein
MYYRESEMAIVVLKAQKNINSPSEGPLAVVTFSK